MSGIEEVYLTGIQIKQLSIIDHYGLEHQLRKLAEECAELIQAILKDKDPFRADIVCEMADVVNLIEQIQLKDELINEGVESIKLYKVNRELDRIGIPRR